jgi:hypothetical protein
MAVKFINIHSKEVRVAETEPMVAALWSSSDRGPNVMQGQDFGWRLAPEVVVEMERISKDILLLERIAARYSKPLEDIKEPDILQWISDKTQSENAPQASIEDGTDEYQAEIRRLRQQEGLMEADATTTTTTKSLADLEAELEARRAAEGVTTTTTATPTTTTTTESTSSN